jgi:hypothetical protein
MRSWFVVLQLYARQGTGGLYKTLEKPHANLHATAAKITNALKDGRADIAMDTYETETVRIERDSTKSPHGIAEKAKSISERVLGDMEKARHHGAYLYCRLCWGRGIAFVGTTFFWRDLSKESLLHIELGRHDIGGRSQEQHCCKTDDGSETSHQT